VLSAKTERGDGRPSKGGGADVDGDRFVVGEGSSEVVYASVNIGGIEGAAKPLTKATEATQPLLGPISQTAVFVAWEQRYKRRRLAEVQLADDERMSLLAMDAVAVVNAAARGTGDGGRGGGGGGWGRKRAVEECEVREMSLRRTSIKYAPAGTEFEQSAVGNGGGCSVGMRHADVGRGDGTRRNDDVEVGDVARVRGSGAAARAGLEPFGATICESSEGVVSRVSRVTEGCDSAGGGGGAICAVKECDEERVEV